MYHLIGSSGNSALLRWDSWCRLFMRKHQTSANWGTFSKSQGEESQGKTEGTGLECMILDGPFAIKNIIGATGENGIEPED